MHSFRLVFLDTNACPPVFASLKDSTILVLPVLSVGFTHDFEERFYMASLGKLSLVIS
jgi:hypothetical protein